jgi:hypothetical protein
LLDERESGEQLAALEVTTVPKEGLNQQRLRRCPVQVIAEFVQILE